MPFLDLRSIELRNENPVRSFIYPMNCKQKCTTCIVQSKPGKQHRKTMLIVVVLMLGSITASIDAASKAGLNIKDNLIQIILFNY